jgi:hypothetical protein
MAGHAGRVRLQQRQPGQLRPRPPGWIAEAGADVLDTEVGHPPVVSSDRPDRQHRLGQAVQELENGRFRVCGGQVAVRETGTDDSRATRGQS